jgi:hypothetical protein
LASVWEPVTEAIKRHPAPWLFAALSAILLYRVAVKVLPVIIKAIVDDRESRRKHTLERLRILRAIDNRTKKKKGDAT